MPRNILKLPSLHVLCLPESKNLTSLDNLRNYKRPIGTPIPRINVKTKYLDKVNFQKTFSNN